jgi:hypothetical protein
MLRTEFAVIAIVLATAGVGCTQCDTCDDFPVPCNGGYCGGTVAPAVPGGYTTFPMAGNGSVSSATGVAPLSSVMPAGPSQGATVFSQPAAGGQPATGAPAAVSANATTAPTRR